MADGGIGVYGRVGGPVIVDLFAGGGGASLGIQWATGVSPIVAINHCPPAIDMHRVNHPDTDHYLASVFDVAPLAASRGQQVDLLWASPDCTHHSRALGGKPRERGRRALAWVVVDWARDVRPHVIALENVVEFAEWGPLGEDGKPIKARRGEHFREWVAALEALGYHVEWRPLVAADYGAPTTRKRLFLVARCDGQPIRWPDPTHGAGRTPWRAAAECIDWNLPCPSIFERKRPLAHATQRRIAEGIRRYVLHGDPFLLCLTHGGRLEPISEPLRTVTTANRGERALVTPIVTKAHTNGSDTAGSGLWSGALPFPTTTTTEQHALVAATLMANNSNNAPHDVCDPLGTVTTGNRHFYVGANLINTRNGERAGQAPRVRDIRDPLATVTGLGSQGGLVAALLSQHNGGKDNPLAVVGRDVREPHRAIVGRPNAALTAVWLDKLHTSARAGVPVTDPMPTVTAGGGRGGGHAALVAAFLTEHLGPMPLDEGLVTVRVGGERLVVADIGMRMLQPRELARANGFPDSYHLTGNISQQVERIGNSVVPQLAEAIVRANLPTLCTTPRAWRAA